MTDGRRRLAALCWVAAALLLVRAASGGGTLAGWGYVASTEPPLVLVAGGVLLALSVTLAIGLLRSGGLAAPRLSSAVSVPTVLYGVNEAAHGHQSGLGLAVAAVAAFVLAGPSVLVRSGAGDKRRLPPAERPDEPD
jgi:hypothetical protein